MARERQRNDLPLSAEINVTSLVDVAFTLLVIFIITAPALQGGIEVDLPDARSRALEVTDPLIVTITAAREVVVGESPVPLDVLEEAMAALFEEGRQGIVRADASAPTGLTVRVLLAIEAGGGRASLATEPPTEL